MNFNSKLTIRDDIAFGVYDLETKAPEVAVIQLATHDFYHFEDDAAAIIGKLLTGVSLSALCAWVKDKLSKGDQPESSFAEVEQFLEEFLPKLFVMDGVSLPRIGPISMGKKLQGIEELLEGEPQFLFSCHDKDRLVLACCELTYACNLRCRHCYNTNHEAENLLPVSRWLSFIREARELGIMGVILTGGDPFCYSGFWDIVEELHRNHMAMDIYTNGQILSVKKTAERLASYYPRSVQCSLYGTKPEIHDAVTTVPGSWNKTVQCLRHCAELNIPTAIKFPIMKVNFGEHFINRGPCTRSWGNASSGYGNYNQSGREPGTA